MTEQCVCLSTLRTKASEADASFLEVVSFFINARKQTDKAEHAAFIKAAMCLL